MTKGRLTREELGWLLTQEAQGAADRLRSGLQVIRTQAPPAPATGADDASGEMDRSLDALDDVMRMLSNLNQRAVGGAPRRGRIDLAALVYEVAPSARVSIEPGSGTEVHGDENDFRRMIQVLIGHAGGAGSSVTIRREGDEVKLGVLMGPDSSPSADTERAWLARMATRYGGRHELDGSIDLLVLPADGVSERTEREALKRELDEARKQGEAYARELAAMLDRDDAVGQSSLPPPPGPAESVRFDAMARLAAGVAGELQSALGPLSKDLGALRAGEVTDQDLETVRRRVAHTLEFVGQLASLGELRADELVEPVDVGAAAKDAASGLHAAAGRAGVDVAVDVPSAPCRVLAAPRAVAALCRQLLAAAVAATPRGGKVSIAVQADVAAVRVVLDDGGPPVPASARRAFLRLEASAGTYGRPGGPVLFACAELASSQGAVLELGDAPQGGLRVTVVFANA